MTPAEILSDANIILNWTPRIGEASLQDFQAAGNFHLLIAKNFIRVHGDTIKQHDPELFERLNGYLNQ